LAEQDRRVQQRVDLPHASVKYVLPDSVESSLRAGCPVGNISLGGLEFLAREPLAQGRELTIELDIRERPPKMILKGRVKWSERQGAEMTFRTGVSFLELPVLERVRVAEIVKNLGRRFAIPDGYQSPGAGTDEQNASPDVKTREFPPNVKPLAEINATNELLLDLLTAYRAGVNFDQVFSSDDIAARKTRAETSVAYPTAPLYELDGANRIRLAESDGLPTEPCVGEIPLPEPQPKQLFACKTQAPMSLRDRGREVGAGALLVFSKSALPLDDDVVMARIGTEGVVCRLTVQAAGNSLRLTPLMAGQDGVVIHARLATAVWRLAAIYEHH